MNRELLAWAASILQEKQGEKFWGEVSFTFKDGRIVRRTFSDSALPPAIEAVDKV